MLGTVLRFELAYWFRRPLTWLFFGALFLMAFLATASEAAFKFGASGAIHRNAPVVIATAMGALTAVGQAITTAVAGTAVLREAQVGAEGLLFTTRLGKADYLVGRFLGALAATFGIYVALPLGLLAGCLMPWVPAGALGPVRPWHVAQPFLAIALPNLLFAGAVLFAVGALTRKVLAVYVSGTALLVAWQLTRELTAELGALAPAALSDPFAITTVSVVTRYWSVAEKNARAVPFAGLLLENRLLWAAAAGALFALVYATFRLRPAPGPRAARRPPASPPPPAARADARPSPRHDGAAARAAFFAAWRLHLRSIVREAPFLAISFLGLTNLVGASYYRMRRLDAVTWPVTATLAPLVSETSHLILVVIATVYGGELVWRERQLRADQVHDALPAPAWATFGGKIAALASAMAALLAAMTLAAMLSQAAQGLYDLQPGLYAEIVGLTALPTAASLALWAAGVHALANQKFVGHLAVVAYYVLAQAASSFGFDHRLAQVGFVPPFTYSDMNGWGPYLPRVVTQQAYGLAVSGLVALAGYLALARGTAARPGGRARQAVGRLRRGGWAAAAALALGAGAAGGYFYDNAHVLNAFAEVRAAERRVAAFERAYERYEGLPQPRITGVELRHDFFPERRAAAWRGTLTAANRHDAPLDTLYVRLPDAAPRPLDRYEAVSNTGVVLDALDLGREAALERDDAAQGVRVYKLARPLAPGESLRVTFAGRFEPRGFPNDAFNHDAAANGSFMGSSYVPGFGYDPRRELADDDVRARHGLAPKAPPRPVDDPRGRLENSSTVDADWIAFAATVCTAPDQIAVAPGRFEREWPEGGRRCFRYEAERPVLGAYATLSGRYAVRREAHRGVELAVYHHPGHAFALDSMFDAAKDGLDYFGANFGPYQFGHFRVVEFPRYQSFAQPLPGTIPFSEGIGFVYRHEAGDGAIDYAYFVTAHELAHQWWGHQVVGADVRGAAVLTESLAEYSALALMERRFGREAAQKFLRRELDGYLEGRGAADKDEVPLLDDDGQRYIHYPKGSLAFYALRDALGEGRLNGALRAFLAAWAFKGPPYPTARDLYAELDRATPPEFKGLLNDLFLEITFFENKAVAAEATRRPDGKYDVRLKLAAKKLRGEGGGATNEARLDDLVDVGVFGDRVPGQKLGKALWVQKVRAAGPELEVEAVVDEAPRRAGIDPYNKLIDRTPEDNVVDVDVRE